MIATVNHEQNPATAAKYLYRALGLRCPSCGTKPMFVKWYKVRSVRDWFTPLDGCPRCGYAYEREPGYFLMSIWAVNYGFGSLLGLALYGILEWQFELTVGQLITAVIVPVFLFSVFFARHSKSIFLAFDLFFDPHQRNGGDDGGNKPMQPPPDVGGAPGTRPVQPCEPAGGVR